MHPSVAPPGRAAGAAAGPLQVQYVAGREPLPPDNRLLALVRYGAGAHDATGPALVVDVPFEQLGTAPVTEAWTVPGPVRRGEHGRVRWAAAGPLLFGTLRAPANAPGALDAASLALYHEMLDATAALGCRDLLRVWNCVPRINEDEDGLERYKRFCAGRSRAFEERLGPDFANALPAASAVGGTGDDLVVYFLAGHGGARHFENPRQVAAWAYPPCYGPRSPSFARATAAPPELGNALFLSGTASVVGHESAHPGDVLAQLDETLRNIAALVDHAAGGDAAGLERVTLLKTYVRHAADRARIEERLRAALGTRVPLLFVQGDICRAELLLEIEGLAR